ncbi:hypothetical protein CEXT_67521 [Caerostris extrusa]|uniref:Uncharacterized protein n=1 Tax=Caerostris extrusa TaxID=172846 RepID=A0AAV4XQT5_CAEEX|nr:hypothetical protein CEXT_67521 [Caerostris extrusa]
MKNPLEVSHCPVHDLSGIALCYCHTTRVRSATKGLMALSHRRQQREDLGVMNFGSARFVMQKTVVRALLFSRIHFHDTEYRENAEQLN